MGFDDSGVCDACRQAEDKENIDWDAREQELLDLLSKYRRSDGRYDCIVPGVVVRTVFSSPHFKIQVRYESFN